MENDAKDMPSRGFAKLDSGICDSSVWMKPHDALRVWIALLAKSDSYGIVRVSAPALAHQCFVTPERLAEIMADFCAPDPDSRTPKDDGRRLQAIEGGWLIINYLLYRDMMQRKAASHAERQAKYREKMKRRDAMVTARVTRDTEADSRGREQKSRSRGKKNPAQASPAPVVLTPELGWEMLQSGCPQAANALIISPLPKWFEHRRKKRWALSVSWWEDQVAHLAKMQPQDAAASLEFTCRSLYQGLVDKKAPQVGRSGAQKSQANLAGLDAERIAKYSTGGTVIDNSELE